ncbi:MAG: hypothetical protein ACREOV_09895, partial [Candidatus Dormibacteraceae bacterium]
EPYRRLMAIHADTGRGDLVRSTWRLLLRRLGEIDVDVEEDTARLYRSLSAEAARSEASARVGTRR